MEAEVQINPANEPLIKGVSEVEKRLASTIFANQLLDKIENEAEGGNDKYALVDVEIAKTRIAINQGINHLKPETVIQNLDHALDDLFGHEHLFEDEEGEHIDTGEEYSSRLFKLYEGYKLVISHMITNKDYPAALKLIDAFLLKTYHYERNNVDVFSRDTVVDELIGEFINRGLADEAFSFFQETKRRYKTSFPGKRQSEDGYFGDTEDKNLSTYEYDSYELDSTKQELARALLKDGKIDQAKQLGVTFGKDADALREVDAEILIHQAQSGEDISQILRDRLVRARKQTDLSVKSKDLAAIASIAARIGAKSVDVFREAINTANLIKRSDYEKFDCARSIAVSLADAGKFESAMQIVNSIPTTQSDLKSFAETYVQRKREELQPEAEKQKRPQNELMKHFGLLESFVDDPEVNRRLHDLINRGRFQEAVNEAKSIPGRHKRTGCLLEIAAIAGENAYKVEDIHEIPDDIVNAILQKSNNNAAIESLGYYNRVPQESLVDIPTANTISYLVANSVVKESAESKAELNKARRLVFEDDSKQLRKVRSFVEGVIDTYDYDTASNELLGVLDQIMKKGTGENDAEIMRLLKGLIGINNPRGVAIATTFFAKEGMPIRYKEYLAQRLLKSGGWDRNLGQYLLTKENPTLSASQAAILDVLIRDFGLTPDLTSYKLFEGNGKLSADTLEGKVAELNGKIKNLEGKSRDELIDIFKNDPASLEIYYIKNIGQYRYNIVSGYSLETFKKLINRVGELQVHEPTLDRFRETLIKSGISENEVDELIQDAKLGKPLITDENRTFLFSTGVERGSSYELAVANLQNVWLEELKSLIFAKARGLKPDTTRESIQTLQESIQLPYPVEIRKLIKRLHLDQEKVEMNDIQAVVKDLRASLAQKYKQADDMERLEEVRDADISELINIYLADSLPESEATSEWRSHFEETLDAIKIADAQRTNSKKVSAGKEIELTFLDKSRDFVRALRFADAARCCFNANPQNISVRTYEYPTRLNKDPLSFAIDLKEAGSNNIFGFIFGRMGINPETGRPVIMLNGLYSQIKGQIFNNNALRIIEEQMGQRLHADMIYLGGSYGGSIDRPEGYKDCEGQEIEAIRALQSPSGDAELKTYDDIGTTANGIFSPEVDI